MEENRYWKDLVSMGLGIFQKQANRDAYFVIKNSDLSIEFNGQDKFGENIEYWNIVFKMKYRDYVLIEERKDNIQNDIQQVLEKLLVGESYQIAYVLIKTKIGRYIDWQAILPLTKENTIGLILEEKSLLIDIATGKSYKDDGLEEIYEKRHRTICAIASEAGFEYPVDCNTLAEWWLQVKELNTYVERRSYISRLFEPVLKCINESDDLFLSCLDFSKIYGRSAIIKQSINDAFIFIREGNYDSAVDRVHTAFHAYLEVVLKDHEVEFDKGDNLSSLYKKVYMYFENNIQPKDVASKIKDIMRSGAGMITKINELRNNNTAVHPNDSLIQEREARLVIKLVNVLVDYIEDIEEM